MIKLGGKIRVQFGRRKELPFSLEYLRMKAILTAINKAPVKTGALRDSIYGRFGKTFFELGATAPYADYQESGTSPYLIRLKNKGRRFVRVPIMTPNGLIFRTLTSKSNWYHPGIKPKGFLKAGIEAIEDEFYRLAVEHVVREMIQGFRENYYYEEIKVFK
jgi:hypothetical protein